MAFGFPLTPMYLMQPDQLPRAGLCWALHYGVIIAFVLAPVAWWWDAPHLARLSGSRLAPPLASRFAGFSTHKTTIGVLLFSGGMAGLA